MSRTRTTGGVEVVDLEPRHRQGLVRFFEALPEGDLTFIKEDVTNPDTVMTWASAGSDRRWVALGGEDVVGYVAVHRLQGWSDHVGEIRLVVAPDCRGKGLGRTLARHALIQAVAAGMTKLVVEIVAEQSAALRLFTDVGFSGEALLENHLRDRQGRLRDLMVLAHHVQSTWSRMQTLGLAEVLEGGPS